MPGIQYNERVFVAGQTGSGKSELVNFLFSGFRCQRVLLDTKGGEFVVAGVEPVSDVEAIDWREPVIHYVTRSTGTAEIDELFQRLNERRNILVCVHELGDLCEMSTNKTPASVNRYLTQGRAWGRGFLGASQRPVDMPKRAKTEVQHVFCMVPAFADPDDMATIAKMLEGMSPDRLRATLDALERELGPHSFLWGTKGAGGELIEGAPLPEHLRARSIVGRAAGVVS